MFLISLVSALTLVQRSDSPRFGQLAPQVNPQEAMRWSKPTL